MGKNLDKMKPCGKLIGYVRLNTVSKKPIVHNTGVHKFMYLWKSKKLAEVNDAKSIPIYD